MHWELLGIVACGSDGHREDELPQPAAVAHRPVVAQRGDDPEDAVQRVEPVRVRLSLRVGALQQPEAAREDEDHHEHGEQGGPIENARANDDGCLCQQTLSANTCNPKTNDGP